MCLRLPCSFAFARRRVVVSEKLSPLPRPCIFGCECSSLAVAPLPAAHSYGLQPQGAGNSSQTAWVRSVSPSPPAPAPFCAISPALVFAAICSRTQAQRWVRSMYTGVQPPRLHPWSPTHGKQGSIYSQLALLRGCGVAERTSVHQNRRCDGRKGDIALQLRRITDMAL